MPPGTAAAAALAGGTLLILAVLGPRVRHRLALRTMLPFLGVGVLFGISYVSLFEAYYRGRVTVVSPIVATESLWGVALSIVFIRHDRAGRPPCSLIGACVDRRGRRADRRLRGGLGDWRLEDLGEKLLRALVSR